MEDLTNTKLKQLAKNSKIPLYTKMSRDELISALNIKEKYSIGWRWSYMKPNLQKKEYNNAMRLLLSPIRNIVRFPDVVRYLKSHPVHITLTTSPTRLPKILTVLATLDTTYITKINVVLPVLYGRNKEP
jgi:hypothetical protein